MSLTLTITSQNFDKKSAEVAYYAKVLQIVAQELQSGQGARTSGPIMGMPPNVASGSVSLGSWTFTPTATNP